MVSRDLTAEVLRKKAETDVSWHTSVSAFDRPFNWFFIISLQILNLKLNSGLHVSDQFFNIGRKLSHLGDGLGGLDSGFR